MPTEYNFDPAKSLFVCTVTGEVTFDQLVNFQIEYFEKYLAKNIILDLSLASVNKIETRDIEAIAEISDSKKGLRPPNSKTAIVASSPVAFGLARMYLIYSELKDLPWESNVFKSMEDALDWI